MEKKGQGRKDNNEPEYPILGVEGKGTGKGKIKKYFRSVQWGH